MKDLERLLGLTADIVAAHVSNNIVPQSEVGELVTRVHQSLIKLTPVAGPEEHKTRKPIVSIKASVQPDYLTCLDCGKKQKALKRDMERM